MPYKVRYNEEIDTDHGVGVKEVLDECGKDKATWKKNDMPDTETLRRMILLADWAAKEPKRWLVYKMYYIDGISSVTEISWKLHIAERTTRRYLTPAYLKFKLKKRKKKNG